MDDYFDFNLTYDFVINDVKYHVKVDVLKIFRAKLMKYLKQGLILENFTVPKNSPYLNNLKNIPINDFDSYMLYVSLPKYSYDENYSLENLVDEFRKWIIRFVYYKLDDDEYEILKVNNKINFRLFVKIRNETWTKEKSKKITNSYRFVWSLGEIIGVEKLNKLNDVIDSYKKYLDNPSQNKKDDFNQQLQDLLENLDDNDLHNLFN